MIERHICVIGAGIVGVSCATVLRGEGHRVTVVDPRPPGEGASKGNAGALAYSETLPLASPGIIAKAPKWLLDPMGPLAIRPAHLPALLPWLWRFWRASSGPALQRGIAALSDLNRLAMQVNPGFYEHAGLSDKLRNTGALHLYETEAEFQRALPGWEHRARQIRFRHVEASELREIEPALSSRITKATLIEDWVLVSDPHEFVTSMAELCMRSGVTFASGEVMDLIDSGDGLEIVVDSVENVTADAAVIAAGAWSGALAELCGDKVPLEAERGYNTTIPSPNITVNRELIFGEHGFVASPLATGLRIGGAAEFAGLDRPPNYARCDAMLRQAIRFLPDLRPESGTQWMGPRPSLPDSLPVIGRATRRNVVHAFGHGHLGLTQAVATAHLVADLIDGRAPAIDIAPFAAGRFSRI